ncbi:probable LRR receptor-like serine/threonine-protein kinase At1g56140 isoform X1 [Zingiber officinale]|uniref:probable LRR receptor-like serine/threonine-protein kinase At1g56140 isoform X1 n=1 Tax=Zingiber officinale TaxID=94328 RepID=UPI001C4A7ADD|nr:probable LRR receptor-like serine/threonine-protein kinase At1g56140 isoform X1 [Zingiber officinale]
MWNGFRVDSGFDPLCPFPSLGSSRSARLWNGFRSSSFLNGVISPPFLQVVALNSILGSWSLKASSKWNFSGEPCSGAAVDETSIDNADFNPGIKCDCGFSNNTCHITKLKVFSLDVTGPIPLELQNLPYLTNLNLGKNCLTGPLPAFFGNFTGMEYLTVGVNDLSGPIPKELGNLQKLISLGLGNNNFTGSIPAEFGNLTNLEQLYVDSAGLSGELPPTLSDLKTLMILRASDNSFTGRIPDYIGGWSNLISLRLQGNSFEGPLPATFSNLTQMTELRIGEIINGSSSLEFISNLTSLSTLVLRNCKISDSIPQDFSRYTSLKDLDLSFNNITGQVPQSLFSLSSLQYLFLGNNSLSGNLPAEKSNSLMNIDLSYNYLSGSFPSWVNQHNLELNLVANNFVIDASNSSSQLPLGLKCLQRDIPCNRGSPNYYSFGILCGGSSPVKSSDDTVYETDNANLSSASYYVTDPVKWGISSVGNFLDAANANYIINLATVFENTLDPDLFHNARMSPSSLRYYGFGLQNGNYSIKLQFSEFMILGPTTWKSLGRRVFDIYIQGDLREKDFDIRKEAGGRSFRAVVKEYISPVTNNFLEIHFFWAGKGTCCTPYRGYYGPSISAISVYPHDFTPTVSNIPYTASPENGPKHKGLIAGVLAGVAVVVFLAICATFMLIQRHKRINEQSKVLKGLDVKPYTFSYAELRAATEDFNPANILGEGGFGPVFKANMQGTLSNGRKVAVKKLSATSYQGKAQFLTEIAVISAVQHRNLVKLHGCCVDEENRILVYEYLENCSLDQIIFGKRDLHLDWPKRFNILLGVAKGLTYLHEESSVRIVHRDVKASNILLDADLNPKISDFGLAKLYDDKISHISTRVAGTIGYLAPEYALRGHLTEKADVFAFGVLALEVVSGRPNSDRLDQETIYLLEWAWNLHENNQKIEAVDRSLTSFDEEEVNRVIGVALLCTQALPAHRPPMSRVVAMLVGDLEIMDVTERPSYLLLWQSRDVSSSSITPGNSDASYRKHGTERSSSSFPVWSTDSVETRILSVESIGNTSIDEGR